jgi:hypothetical protein
VRLFGRKKETEQQGARIDPATDDGIIGIFYAIVDRVEADFANATAAHLQRLHEPEGYAREKSEHDFMDLGMSRDYLYALDDLEFTVQDSVTVPQYPVRRRGMAVVVSRWTARGTHNRPLADGDEPSGEQVTIEGVTYTAFRNYNIRTEYTYWHMPEFTRRMVER